MLQISAKPRVWSEINNAVMVLVDEYKMVLEKDGIRIKAVDPAHVAMVEIFVPNQFFTIVGDESEDTVNVRELGLDTDVIKKLLRAFNENYSLLAKYDGRRLRFIGRTPLATSAEFSTNLVSTEGIADPKVPALTLPCVFDVRPEIIREAMKVNMDISDHVAFIVNDKGGVLLSEGEVRDFKTHIYGANPSLKEEYRSLFPADYTQNVFNGLAPCTFVKITMGNELPIKIEGTTFNGVKIMYLLAPRLEM